MGFLDKITDSIAETGQEIKRVAGQTSAKSQMHSDLKKREKDMEALVYQIGLQMVSNHPEICEEKYPDLYKNLVDTREAAKQLRNQLALAEVEVVCPGCGRTIKGVTKFCTYCGTTMPEPNLNPEADYSLPNNKPIAANPNGPKCVKCGAALKPGAAFCINCGTPVEEAAPTPTPVAAAELSPMEAAPAEEAAVISAEATATCSNCGAEIFEGDAFCTNCGTPVQ